MDNRGWAWTSRASNPLRNQLWPGQCSPPRLEFATPAPGRRVVFLHSEEGWLIRAGNLEALLYTPGTLLWFKMQEENEPALRGSWMRYVVLDAQTRRWCSREECRDSGGVPRLSKEVMLKDTGVVGWAEGLLGVNAVRSRPLWRSFRQGLSGASGLRSR